MRARPPQTIDAGSSAVSVAASSPVHGPNARRPHANTSAIVATLHSRLGSRAAHSLRPSTPIAAASTYVKSSPCR